MRFSLLRLLILTALAAVWLGCLFLIWSAIGITPGGGIVIAFIGGLHSIALSSGYLETQLRKLLPPHK